MPVTLMSDPNANRFIRSHLKIRHLTLLVELGRHGSIAQAAEAAGLTQPAASKLLGELEYALGVPLFQRLPRGVEPTEYGRIMMRRAGAALAEMDAAHQEVQQGLAGVAGRVRLGAVLTPAAQLVPDAVQRLKQDITASYARWGRPPAEVAAPAQDESPGADGQAKSKRQSKAGG